LRTEGIATLNKISFVHYSQVIDQGFKINYTTTKLLTKASKSTALQLSYVLTKASKSTALQPSY
jgi:hypothetical protein